MSEEDSMTCFVCTRCDAAIDEPAYVTLPRDWARTDDELLCPACALAGPERWLPIPGYEGYYEVSDHGRVRSLSRRITHGAGYAQLKGKVLSPGQCHRFGYRNVGLYRGGRSKSVRIHILVLMAFQPPRPPGLVGRHLDGNPRNNHVSNLRWGTMKENAEDRVRHGTHARGERTGTAKLTADDVRAIRASTVSARRLAEWYPVTENHITRIRRRERWAHID